MIAIGLQKNGIERLSYLSAMLSFLTQMVFRADVILSDAMLLCYHRRILICLPTSRMQNNAGWR